VLAGIDLADDLLDLLADKPTLLSRRLIREPARERQKRT
jgi:hypothetical protein